MEQAAEHPEVLVGIEAVRTFLNEIGVAAGRSWVAENLANGTLPAKRIAGKYHATEGRLREWAGL